MIAWALGKVPWLGTAIKALPWVLAAAGLVGTLWFRGEWESCRASVALDAAKAQERVNAQKEADAKMTRSLEETLAPIKTAIQEQSNATQIALAKVQSDPNCRRTPATDAFDGSVLNPGLKAGAGPKNAARP